MVKKISPISRYYNSLLGHIGIAVPDVYKACERFEKLGVNFVKKPDDGKSFYDYNSIRNF